MRRPRRRARGPPGRRRSTPAASSGRRGCSSAWRRSPPRADGRPYACRRRKRRRTRRRCTGSRRWSGASRLRAHRVRDYGNIPRLAPARCAQLPTPAMATLIFCRKVMITPPYPGDRRTTAWSPTKNVSPACRPAPQQRGSRLPAEPAIPRFAQQSYSGAAAREIKWSEDTLIIFCAARGPAPYPLPRRAFRGRASIAQPAARRSASDQAT